jgi:hypothetical protein
MRRNNWETWNRWDDNIKMDVSMSASEKKLCSMELDNVLKELNS